MTGIGTDVGIGSRAGRAEFDNYDVAGKGQSGRGQDAVLLLAEISFGIESLGDEVISLGR